MPGFHPVVLIHNGLFKESAFPIGILVHDHVKDVLTILYNTPFILPL